MSVLALLCAAVAFAIVGMVVMVAVLDWAGHLPIATRLSLCTIAAGLMMAGPARWSASPGPGLGDLVFLAGVYGVMAAVYGARLRHRLDRADGRADGHVDLGAVVQLFDPRTRRRRPF